MTLGRTWQRLASTLHLQWTDPWVFAPHNRGVFRPLAWQRQEGLYCDPRPSRHDFGVDQAAGGGEGWPSRTAEFKGMCDFLLDAIARDL